MQSNDNTDDITDLNNQYDEIFGSLVKQYKIKGKLGAGGFGIVFDAKDRLTGQKVAIKMIEVRQDSYYIRKLLREIIILRKLSEMEDNVFTNKLLDVILPTGVQNEIESQGTFQNSNFTHVFLVLEKSDRDLKTLLDL